MKNIIVIAFVSLYLSATTEIFELLKIPTLVSHFFEHQSENQTITFVDFLAMHYSENNTHYKDKHKNSTKLPFKCADTCFSGTIFVTFLAPKSSYFINQKLIFFERTKLIFSHTSVFICNFNSSIWQPPKIC